MKTDNISGFQVFAVGLEKMMILTIMTKRPVRNLPFSNKCKFSFLMLGGNNMHAYSVISNSLWSHGPWPIRLLCPWDWFSRQEYWSGLPCPPPGIDPVSLMSPALAGMFFAYEPLGKPKKQNGPPYTFLMWMIISIQGGDLPLISSAFSALAICISLSVYSQYEAYFTRGWISF